MIGIACAVILHNVFEPDYFSIAAVREGFSFHSALHPPLTTVDPVSFVANEPDLYSPFSKVVIEVMIECSGSAIEFYF